MSNNYSDVVNIMKEMQDSDLNISKDILKVKKSIKNIEDKIYSMEDTVNRMFEILNTISVFIEEAEDQGELDTDEEVEESWNPYGIQSEYDEYYDDEDDEEDTENGY